MELHTFQCTDAREFLDNIVHFQYVFTHYLASTFFIFLLCKIILENRMNNVFQAYFALR